MRASGRPPYSHRDPSRPGRGVDRPGLSLGALAHRLMSLRASLTRRLAGPPRHPGYSLPRPAQSWSTAPGALVGRGPEPHLSYPDALAPWTEAERPEAGWPDQVFDDRAGFERPLPDSRPESRIDHAASTPGVLVRQPRRPAAIAPEGAPLPDAHAALRPAGHAGMPGPAEPSAVRYTRTPDTILQERRQRALEAERIALERARAEADAANRVIEEARRAAEHADAERATAQAEAARIEAETAAAEAAAEAARLAAGPALPLWRQPFVAPPGVRYFRTPDRRPARPAVEMPTGSAHPDEAPLPAPAPEPADFSDLPEWSAVQPWFGEDDLSSVEVWAGLEHPEAPAADIAEVPAAPAAEAEPYVSLPVDISHLRSLPPKPVYVLDRLVRFDMPPRPADLQDNAAARAAAEAASAFLPPRPTLSLVFGTAEAASEAVSEPLPEPVFEAPAVAGPLPSPAAAPEVPRPLRPVLSAMAARAAIRPAREPAAEPFPPQAPMTVPAARFAAAEAVVPAPVAAPVAAPAPVVVPIPSRPVLLRGRAAEPAPSDGEPVAEAADVLLDTEPEPVAAAEPEEAAAPLAAPAPANLPAVVRPHLIPAGRHLEVAAFANADYTLPSLELLALPAPGASAEVDADVLEQNALNLQQTVQDFGVRGDILAVRPGPVVTLYELEPAPGTKSSRVIGLSDDIARSMSAVSARVAVVPGRNVIGIELPNETRETVYLRELLSAPDFAETKHKLALCLGKNIGGEPIIADLARMPHLLVAGTTGSGKSVAINTMILSLLYRLKPEECRLIMVDPKMLELSVYDGIPHLLSPVVIDPKKAVIALKWAVREMEERYKKMSKIAVRNIDGYNARMKEARERGETITRTVQTGFDRQTGEAVYEDEAMDLSPLPYIVIVVDEMADLMMVAGKDIEGAIQRLAQMARAAGIHLIMATQRPSVDVITGTIKANFPTRISFQVTSKIDSRTILGEMGAEQLLGQGDMLFMAGGGRTTRVHGPFCSDAEVESVVAHLKRQGRPAYLDAVTADEASEEAPAKGSRGAKAPPPEEREEEAPVFDVGAFAASVGGEAGDLYEQAVQVVLRDQKASTSYIQRRLQIGYNRAASLMERMEIEGIVGPANHAGKREILVDGGHHASSAMGSAMYDDD
ncbi:DNA translocase FtsK [Methylobacterium symbioticum]